MVSISLSKHTEAAILPTFSSPCLCTKYCILIEISLQSIARGPKYNEAALVDKVACRLVDLVWTPLSKLRVAYFIGEYRKTSNIRRT